MKFLRKILGMEKLLDEANKSLDILHNVPTPVMAIDKNFNVTYMNRAGANAVSKTQQQCIGMKCFDLFKTPHCNTPECATGQCMRENRTCTNDTFAKLPSGELPIRYSGTPLKDENGNIIGGLEFVVDITEENRAVQEVDSMVSEALNGVLDARGNPDNYTIQGFKGIIKGINDTLDAIVNPLKEVAATLKEAAGKDLRSRVMGDYKGAFDELKTNVNSTMDALDSSLGQVASAVEQISSASCQISSGSQNLAQGANEQASSLEEVSSSLEEITAMIRQSSENSGQAKTLSGSSKTSASKGIDSMQHMSEAIDKIMTSSEQTSKIIKTIDEIAFQTNLLALNAAVEAARAGEAGKGFAVVAEEVRNLAQRSAEAAKNTAEMIEDSVKNAEGGVQITQEVARSLNEIADGSVKVNDLVTEIAAAIQEQSQGIEQINTTTTQLNDITQQNAANSEESASAAEELNSQSEELSNMLSEFTLSESGSGGFRGRASQQVSRQQSPAAHATASNRIRTSAADHNGTRPAAGKPEKIIPLDFDDF